MSISSKELASKLNISRATVSMALNNKKGISEETREFVLNAAKQYGLKIPTKTKQKIVQFIIFKNKGFIVTDTPFFSKLIEGINKECKNKQIQLQISYLYKTNLKENETLLNTEADGIIILGTEIEKEDLTLLINPKIPTLLLDANFTDINIDSITINNSDSSYLAIKKMIDKDYKEIGYLASNIRITNFIARENGIKRALDEKGLFLKKEYIHYLTPTMENSYLDMKNILINKDTKLAKIYFADNDLIAAGAMKALIEFGYSIPKDIKIIGFDDMPLATFISPTLSSISVPKEYLGIIAIKRLLERIENPNLPTCKIMINTSFIERETTLDV